MPIQAASSASLVATASTIAPPLGAPDPTLSPPEWLELSGVETAAAEPAPPPSIPWPIVRRKKDAVIAMIGHQIRRPRSLIIQVKYGTFANIDRYIRGLIQSER
jgi:hypothetical protein